MLNPVKIRFQNLLSHKDSEYIFLDDKTLVVSGVNEDDRGVESNGSGKSTIIEALAIALTGSPFRDIKNSELVRNEADFLEIELTLKNSTTGNVIKIVRRIFSGSKPSKVELYENGILNESVRDLQPKESNKKILELLDLTNDDLLNYFIVSKETYKSFFLSTDGQKKEIINRFSKAYMIDGIEEQIKTDITLVNQDILAIDREKLSLESKIQVYEEQLLSIENSEEEENGELSNLKVSLREAKNQLSIIDKEELPKLKKIKEDVESELVTDSPSEYLESIHELKQMKKQLEEEKEKISLALEEQEEFSHSLNKVIIGAVDCPKCLHRFSINNSEISVMEATEMVPQIDDMIKSYQNDICTVNESISEINNSIKEFQSEIGKIEERVGEIGKRCRRADQDFQAKLYEFKKCQDRVNYLNDSINNFQIVDKTLPIKKNIKSLNEKIGEVLLNLAHKQKTLSELQYCAANFKKFRSYLANQSIKAIEAYTNHFLQQMNTNLSVKIDGFRMLASGKIKEEIETTISRDGFTSENFNKFSSGEKTKVDIAGILALQSIINNNSNNGLNLLCLDEIIESVDGTAAREILKSLKMLKQNIILITHTSYNSDFENVLRVVKKNGISTILN